MQGGDLSRIISFREHGGTSIADCLGIIEKTTTLVSELMTNAFGALSLSKVSQLSDELVNEWEEGSTG
jgi:hypothetical protein